MPLHKNNTKQANAVVNNSNLWCFCYNTEGCSSNMYSTFLPEASTQTVMGTIKKCLDKSFQYGLGLVCSIYVNGTQPLSPGGVSASPKSFLWLIVLGKEEFIKHSAQQLEINIFLDWTTCQKQVVSEIYSNWCSPFSINAQQGFIAPPKAEEHWGRR